MTIGVDAPLTEALALMVEHSYSQLPVVDGQRKPVAMLSADSITHALNAFGVAPDALRVLDGMEEQFRHCRADDDVLDVLDDLLRTNAMLVLDAQGVLTGVITNYDTTEYFRLRAQDIMWVRDVEETIKEYVRSAFKDGTGAVDEASLNAAIEEITPSNVKELNGPFRKALSRYLELTNSGIAKLDDAAAKKAFDENLLEKGKVKSFDKLSLGEYIELLLHKKRWSKYEPIFKLKPESLRHLLASVRETRNDLAHLRDDISPIQRTELRQCRNWLNRHEDAIEAAFTPAMPTGGQEPGGAERALDLPPGGNSGLPQVSPHKVEATSSLAAVEKSPAASVDELHLGDAHTSLDSRYSPLGRWLDALGPEFTQLNLQFTKIETIIGGKLPASAREYRSWWGNARKNPHSRQWLDAGWQVLSVNMRRETVSFIASRQERYEAFFTALAAALKAEAPTDLRVPFPSGKPWFILGKLPESGQALGLLAFSFARNAQFRVELLLNAPEPTKNKQVFDALLGMKGDIEAELGKPLSWERLDDQDTSRIAIYRPGSSRDDEQQLAALRTHAVADMLAFWKVMKPRLEEIAPRLNGP